MRYLTVLTVCLCFGCGPTLPTRVQPTPDYIGLDSLTMHYVNRGRSYDNRLIQVRLPAGTYTTYRGRIEANLCDGVGLCVFETTATVVGNEAELTVTGLCRGAIRDGVQRCGRYDWHVRVEGCTVEK